MASLSRFRCILSPCSNAGPVGSWFSSTSNSYELLVWSSKAVAKSWHCLLSSWNRDISPIFSTTFSSAAFINKNSKERNRSPTVRSFHPLFRSFYYFQFRPTFLLRCSLDREPRHGRPENFSPTGNVVSKKFSLNIPTRVEKVIIEHVAYRV